MSRKPKTAEPAEDERDEELEEGLEDTFPASDPPAVTQPVHRHPPPKKH